MQAMPSGSMMAVPLAETGLRALIGRRTRRRQTLAGRSQLAVIMRCVGLLRNFVAARRDHDEQRSRVSSPRHITRFPLGDDGAGPGALR